MGVPEAKWPACETRSQSSSEVLSCAEEEAARAGAQCNGIIRALPCGTRTGRAC